MAEKAVTNLKENDFEVRQSATVQQMLQFPIDRWDWIVVEAEVLRENPFLVDDLRIDGVVGLRIAQEENFDLFDVTVES